MAASLEDPALPGHLLEPVTVMLLTTFHGSNRKWNVRCIIVLCATRKEKECHQTPRQLEMGRGLCILEWIK